MNKYTKLFKELLCQLDFELVKYEDGFGLDDLQGPGLGDIETERFKDAAGVLDRLELYISDCIVTDLEDELSLDPSDTWQEVINKARKADVTAAYAWEIDALDLAVNHAGDVSIEECFKKENEENEDL